MRTSSWPGWRRWSVAMAAVGLLGTALWVVFSPGFLNYDAVFVLIWGEELHNGLPDYAQPGAPTPHPLANAVAAGLTLLPPDGAYLAMELLGFAAWAAVLVLMALIGRSLDSWLAGVFGAGLLLLSPSFTGDAAKGRIDIPFVALCLAALLAAMQGPHRARTVLVLLACAGLLRPEAWLLAAGYVMIVGWSASRESRIRLLALASAGPLIWATTDFIATGSPFWSLVTTRSKAAILDRPTGLSGLTELLTRIDDVTGLAVAAAGLAGIFALGARGSERVRLPAAVAMLGLVGFLLLGLIGLPLNNRYLFLPGAVFAVFAGAAVVRWRSESGPLRTVLIVVGVLATAALAVDAPDQIRAVRSVSTIADAQRMLVRDVRMLARRVPQSCGPIYVSIGRTPLSGFQPELAWSTRRPTSEIRALPSQAPRSGAAIVSTPALRSALGVTRPTSALPGWKRGAQTPTTELFERCE